MALVSSRALLPRKCVAAVTIFVFVGLISVSCFGHPVFLTVPSTPYDRQMIRVYPVLTSTNGQRPAPISSLFEVNQLLTELRAMPYRYSRYWQTPTEVNLAQAADCKGKAVALYAEMRKNGAKNVRVVIGKRHIYASVTHAWLEWETKEGNYMLDPTFNNIAINTAELSPMTYLPLYAYDGEHKYRAAETSFVAAPAKVAAGYSNRFYVPAGASSSFGQPGPIQARAGQSFPATTGYAVLSTQNLRSEAQGSWSNARRSSSTVEGFRYHEALVARRRPATARRAPDVRHSASDAERLRQVRSSISSQNLEYVMQMQLRRLPSQL